MTPVREMKTSSTLQHRHLYWHRVIKRNSIASRDNKSNTTAVEDQQKGVEGRFAIQVTAID